MSGGSALKELFGDKIVGKDGEVDVGTLGDCDLVGVYFSAHWCPPCRMFTPQLAEYYNNLKGKGKKIEIIFVSSDKNEEAWKEYYGEMPWLALPYEDRAKKDALSGKYGVRGIPTLVFLNPQTGETVTLNGRGAVSSDPSGEKFPNYAD